MKAIPVPLTGCFEIDAEVREDGRGYFYEGFNAKDFHKATGEIFDVKQINQSMSKHGVLRGLHFQQAPKAQSKLVTCIEGTVLDVAVDLRRDSDTFGQYHKVILSDENKRSFFIPKGMAHGFLVMSNQARLMYLTDEFYYPKYDSGVIYNDIEINIDWGIEETQMILSAKDKSLPTLEKINL